MKTQRSLRVLDASGLQAVRGGDFAATYSSSINYGPQIQAAAAFTGEGSTTPQGTGAPKLPPPPPPRGTF